MKGDTNDSVGCQTVVTSVIYYCSVVADLSVSRSVHATELEPCFPDPFLLSSSECRAVHYGICSSLLKLPTFLAVNRDAKDVNQNEAKKNVASLVNRKEQQMPKATKNVASLFSRKELQMPKVTQRSCAHSKLSSGDDQSALELLAANIESSVKPLISTLSKTKSLGSSTTEVGGESVGELASSLQYHLGNFLTAFRQQQKCEEIDIDVQDLSNTFEELKSLSSLVHNSHDEEGLGKELTLQTKDLFLVNDDKVSIKNGPSNIKYTRQGKVGSSENGLKITESDLTREWQKLPHSSYEIANNTHRYLEVGPIVKEPSDTSAFASSPSFQKKEEKGHSKSSKFKPRYESSELDDSDILDSLISLMNVSLTGLNINQPISYNDAENHQIMSNKKFSSRRNHIDVVNDKKIQGGMFWNAKAEVPTDGKLQNISCRTKLIFPEEFGISSFETPRKCSRNEESFGILRESGPHGVLKGMQYDLETRSDNVEKRSTSPLHQDGLPVIPLSDVKRVPQPRDRYSGSSDSQNLLFSTKASVAERVMALEKCPAWNFDRTDGTRNSNQHVIKMGKETESPKGNFQPSHQIRSESFLIKCPWDSIPIPKFYFPHGQPTLIENLEAQLDQLKNVFQMAGGRFIKDNFHVVTKVCSLPLYWKLPLYLSVESDDRNCVTMDRFFNYWRRLTNNYPDKASRFVYILSRSKRSFLVHEDFRPMIQDIIDTHPGLTFLRNSKEFHSRYIDTVIARIFYNVNRSWSGKITALELRKSTFLQVVSALEEEDDINQMMDYFSYEHFYVIYCKFWKIDLDHDLLISKMDLKKHNNGDISMRMIERIFSGAITRGEEQKTSQMQYIDFVWFLLSEEDKRHPRSIEYWFRCMDLDGDGFLSMYELEYFYEEQVQRMESLGIEALPFKDCLCQMLDMVRPKIQGKITLSDLKNCKMTTLFFDTFFNLGKYLEHEQRDPFAYAKESEYQNQELSDWCKYAEEEYNFLVSEENIPQYRNDSHANKTVQVESQNLDPDFTRAVFTHPNFNSSALNRCFVKDDDDDDDYDYADSDADY